MQIYSSSRILSIDILRGLAILIMIPANYMPLLVEPHSQWFRLISSLAAPVFIMLSTGMVVLNAHKHNFQYYLVRGLIILLFASLLDLLLWRSLPFTAGDILYTIGISLPFIYCLRKWKTSQLIALGMLFLLMSCVLQAMATYEPVPLYIHLNDLYWPGSSRILKSWLLDGWFPIFPWLGYAVLGAVFFRVIFSSTDKVKTYFLSFGIIFTGLGLLGLFLPVNWFPNLVNGGILQTRGGYSEIFYPPTIVFMIYSLGCVCLLYYLCEYLSKFKFSGILQQFGMYSLLIYILHLVIEVEVLQPLLEMYQLKTIHSGYVFSLVILVIIVTLYCICKLIDYIKSYVRPKSLVLQMLFGK